MIFIVNNLNEPDKSLLYCYCILFSMKKNFISTEIVFIVNVTLLYK